MDCHQHLYIHIHTRVIYLFCLSSQSVLHDVPDYEERKKLLENLKNKLEALLSPRLVAAFNSHNLGKLIL